MSVSDADLQSLLHTLVEQQTALLNVQAENARLQRVLIERLLGSDAGAPVHSVLGEPRASEEWAPEGRPATKIPLSEFVSGQTQTATPAGHALQSPSAAGQHSPPDAAASAVQLPTSPEPAPNDLPGGQEQPVATGGAPKSRVDRYYRARPAGDGQPARPMGLDTLDLLRSIQAVGEPAQLVVTFGPHAGETPGRLPRAMQTTCGPRCARPRQD